MGGKFSICLASFGPKWDHNFDNLPHHLQHIKEASSFETSGSNILLVVITMNDMGVTALLMAVKPQGMVWQGCGAKPRDTLNPKPLNPKPLGFSSWSPRLSSQHTEVTQAHVKVTGPLQPLGLPHHRTQNAENRKRRV